MVGRLCNLESPWVTILWFPTLHIETDKVRTINITSRFSVCYRVWPKLWQQLVAVNKVQRRQEQSIIRKWSTSLYCCGTPQVLQLLQSCVGPQHGHPPCIRRDRSSAPSRLRHLSSTISFNQPRVWFSQARFEFEGWYLNTSKRVSPKVLRMGHATVLSE